MKAHYTNTKSIDNKPSRRRRILKWVFYLTATGISVAAAITVASQIHNDDGTDNAPQPIGYTRNDLTTPGTFMAAYLAANSSPELLENTQTIRITGTIEENGKREAFTLIRKRPNKMLFTLKRKTHEMTFGVNGDKVWRRVRAPQHDDLISYIEGDEAQTWLAQRSFFDEIIDAHLHNRKLDAVEFVDWKGSKCVKVRINKSQGNSVNIYVDPKSLHPVAKIASQADGTTQQTKFSDYRDISGLPIPFQMTTVADGAITSHLQLESAALNKGILSQLFDIPQPSSSQNNHEIHPPQIH